MSERVVLAHSGGPDTSVAIGWVAEEAGAEVVAVAGDGGQLYDFSLATCDTGDTGDTGDQGLAKGFVQLRGMPAELAAARDQRQGGAA